MNHKKQRQSAGDDKIDYHQKYRKYKQKYYILKHDTNINNF